jgi:ribosomal protein L11 methyltransferase
LETSQVWQGGAVKLIEIGVETDGEAAEAISAVFNRYSQNGTVIEEVWSKPSAPPVIRVKTFLSAEQSCALPRIEEALWYLGRLYPIPAPSVRYLAEADWAEAWKSGYKTLRIGRRIVIKPSWQSYAATPDQVVIELDPGLAFGTGLHPSTQLMLEALERHVELGDRVLDVGTGSGILAIAAVKLGADNVVALDIDSLALEVARENLSRNGVQDRISLLRASLTPPSISGNPQNPPPVFDARSMWSGAFDLLLMNILADVIVRSAEPIAACLAEGGRLIVSGVIQPQEEHVRQALLAAGLKVAKRRSKKDWVALIGRKGNREREGA